MRRNSVMYDLLFVSLSHPLSACIFSLDNDCKQLPENKRTEYKGKLDPTLSDGMNGYISLCAGDPCPPIFRSPIAGMEDILDNQAICAIYRLPDVHKHIIRPLAGVVFPKKLVTVDDMKPQPVLWHEDYGRKPWQNGRERQIYPRAPQNVENPPQSISGRQLAEASHRLIRNSLQVKADSNLNGHQVHASPSLCTVGLDGQFRQPYPIYGVHDQRQYRSASPRADLQGRHWQSNPSVPMPYENGHPQQHASSRGCQNERNNHGASYNSNDHKHGHYPSVPHQVKGLGYPPRALVQQPVGVASYPYQQGFHPNNQNILPGASTFHQHGSTLAPPPNQSSARENPHPPPGNRFSRLDGRTSRRPPQSSSGYGRS